MGLLTRRQPPVVRHWSAPRRRLFVTERRHVVRRRTIGRSSIGSRLAAGDAMSIRWQVAAGSEGVRVTPSAGTLTLSAAAGRPGTAAACGLPASATTTLALSEPPPGRIHSALTSAPRPA